MERPKPSPANTSRIGSLFDVSRWNLQTRVVYTTGIILLLGALTTLLAVSYSLKQSAREAIEQKVYDFETAVGQAEDGIYGRLRLTAAAVAAHPGIAEALAGGNRDSFLLELKRYTNDIEQSTGSPIPAFSVYTHDLEPVASGAGFTHRYAHASSAPQFVAHALETGTITTGLQENSDGPLYSLAIPVTDQRRVIGAVACIADYETFFQAVAKHLHGPYGLTIFFQKAPDDAETGPIGTTASLPENEETTIRAWGIGKQAVVPSLSQLPEGQIGSEGNFFFVSRTLTDFSGKRIGSMLLQYDGAKILTASNSTVLILSLLTVFGVALLSISLYLNVARIKNFFTKMQSLLIASQSTDFSTRFTTPPVACFETLSCDNRECHVYQDKSRICYLETGDRAISPTLRNTCIHLDTYGNCRSCPVYKKNTGDEITEMKHLVNHIMGLWGSFLSTVSDLLADVLNQRSRGVAGLDDISHYLEQMARLTSFSHDLQGVFNKEEVYRQLEYVFRNRFGLTRFHLFEVNASENRMESAIDAENLTASHSEVFLDCEYCRAKRVAEDVISESNPMLCPYFGIETEKEVRCCLPMVMGGRVGAVFTFVESRSRWPQKKQELVILKKYLDETAPILASLRLLQISKEQSLKDPLTLCHNRRFMDQFLVQFENLNQRNPRNLGFIMADLDHFKMVNDEFGHLAGDEVLKQLADIFRNNIRKSDLLIRYGGEEFLIILIEMTEQGLAESIAEKLRLAVEKAHLMLPSSGYITKTVSMGVAEYPTDADQLYKVIKYADVALYQAKERGRNQVLRFTSEMWQGDDY